jgi:hypothetical protein
LMNIWAPYKAMSLLASFSRKAFPKQLIRFENGISLTKAMGDRNLNLFGSLYTRAFL